MFKKVIFIVIIAVIVIGVFLKFTHSSYESHFNKGLAYFKSGDYEKAIAEYKKAEKKTVPSDEGLQYAFANTYTQMGDYNKATLAYETIINYYPNDMRAALAYKFLAALYILEDTGQKDMRRLTKALEYMEKAYNLDPSKMSETDMNTLKTLREAQNKWGHTERSAE